MVAVAWTLDAIILAGLAGFFFDARTERRSIKTTIDQMRVELKADIHAQTARIDQMGSRIEQMGSRMDQMNTRVDEVVKNVGEIKGDIKLIKAHLSLAKSA